MPTTLLLAHSDLKPISVWSKNKGPQENRSATFSVKLGIQNFQPKSRFFITVSSIDLISLKIQILGGKVLLKNLGFESQWGRVKFFAIFLLFCTFFILFSARRTLSRYLSCCIVYGSYDTCQMKFGMRYFKLENIL